MIIKYKVSDFAKDVNQPAKQVLESLNEMGITNKKVSSNLEEQELNLLLEKVSRDNAENNLNDYLNSANPEHAKANGKKQHTPQKKHEEKKVSLSELAKATGAKAPAKAAKTVEVKR